MAEPIKHNDIIEISKTIAGINDIIKQLKKLQAEMKKTAQGVIAFQKSQDPSTPKGKEGTKTASGQTSKLVAEEKKLTQSTKELTKAKVELQEQNRKNRQEWKQQIAVEKSAKGSLNRLRAEYNKMSATYNSTADVSLKKKLIPQMQAADKEIKKQEEAVGKHQRSVGKYSKVMANAKAAIKSFAIGMVGATAIITGLSRAFKKITGIAIDFEQGMANVKAITNASTKDFFALSKSAITLGRVTKFTATQVAELQFEYAKLGFTTEEILNASKATLDLAAATGTDLARAAEVAGGVIRAFALDASEAKRVTDVMALSFATSALDMEKFAESMKMVSKVADVSNLSVERTTAILGVLANNMIQGSMAGTSLRKILAETGVKAEGFEGRLRKLAATGLSLADAQDEVGKRAFGALLVLTEQWEMVEKLTIAYEDAEGASERMAEIMLDTAKGQRDIVKSSFEGLVLTAENSTEAMEGYKDSLGRVARALNWVSDNFTKVSKGARLYGKALMFPITMNTDLIKLIGSRRRREKQFSEEEAARAVEEERLSAEEIQRLKEEGEALAELADIKKKLSEQEEKEAKRKLQAELRIANVRLKQFDKESDFIEAEIERGLEDIAFEEDLAQAKIDIAKERNDRLEQVNEDFRTAEFEAEEKAREAGKTAQEKADDEDKAATEKAEDEKRRGIEASIMAGANLAFAVQDLRMSRLQAEKDREIELADGNKEKILAIEKEFGEKQKKIAITTALIDSSVAIVKALASIAPPFNFVVAGLVAAATGIQVAAINSQTFAKGGHGELGGERHSQGGTHIPGIGEAEKGEYFGIVNRQMTQRYRNDLPAIFDSLNSGKFHNVWDRSNIQIQTNIDPWTKKMYDQMMKTPTVYTDSDGRQVLQYPDGYTRVIKKG